MSRLQTRKGWLIFLSLVGLLFVLVISAVEFLNPRLTQYVESEKLRAEMEKETAKGLHFLSGTLRADQAHRDVDGRERRISGKGWLESDEFNRGPRDHSEVQSLGCISAALATGRGAGARRNEFTSTG